MLKKYIILIIGIILISMIASMYDSTSIEVLNPQSYPSLGGIWEVNFITKGKSDLKITPIDGTTWDDLSFIKLKCNNTPIDYDYDGVSIIAYDYLCNEGSFEQSKVLTLGKHHLEFEFGGNKAYANNNVDTGWLVQSGRHNMNGTNYINLNISVQVNHSFIIYGVRDYTAQVPNVLGVYADWTNGSQFKLTQHTKDNIPVVWQVIEGAEIYVQNGTKNYTTETSFNISIEPINTSRTVAIMTLGSCSYTINQGMNEVYWTGNVTNSTNLYIQRDDGANCKGTVGYFVVEFNDESSISYGQIDNVGTNNSPSDIDIAPYMTNKTWLYFSKAQTDASLDETPRVWSKNTTAFSIARMKDDGTARVQWYAITNDNYYVQNGSVDCLDGVGCPDAVLENITVNNSFVYLTFDNLGTGFAQDNLYGTAYIANETGLQIIKGTAVNNATFSYQVIQFGNKTIISTIGESCTLPCDGSNHVINCSHNCTTTTNCDMQGGNITWNDAGTWMIRSNISNYDTFISEDNSRCFVIVEGRDYGASI